MVDPNTRQGKRTPVTLKIKFKSETLEQFIERYAVDVSQGGIFIRTKEPLAVGTQMRFEFQLRDASPLIAGEGTVVWTRENDPSRPAIAPGMGVRFDRLAEGSQTVLERILSEKAKQAPQRTHESSTKPPLFTDTPTKVAPLPVQEALLDGRPKRNTKDFVDQHTPLPKPMPFHSDAEDFDEQAFEEATKVRALDELIAQTADGGASEPGGATAIIPPDELAARRVAAGGRADSTLADAPTFAKPASEGAIGVAKASAPDRDSAPGLPSPPTAGAPRLLDASPSPRAVETPAGDLGKTKLGFDAPRTGSPSTPPKSKMATPPPGAVSQAVSAAASTSGAIKDVPTRPSGLQAVATEPSGPSKRPVVPAQKSSAVPIAILILVLLAAGAGGVWFFVLRPKAQEANEPRPGSGSVVKSGPGSQTATPGSGSQVASTNPGSGSQKAGSNAETPPVPKGPVVDTVIASSVDKSIVEIVDTDQKGPAPFTAKLEKDKPYKARITAPGFAATELDIKGGDAKQTAKLVPKPRFVTVNTDPAGALIFVDGSATGHTTPHEVELTKAQAAKKSVRITMRKAGFRQLDKNVVVADYQEEDSKLVASIEGKLTQQQIVRPPPPDRGSGAVKPPDGAGSGSATPPDPGTGSGSATSPTPPNPGSGSSQTPPTPTGGSSATPPAGTGSASKPTTPTTTTPPAGTGSASKPTTPTTPPAGAGSQASKSPSEPEPDFVKK